ncbi:MAG: PSD1 and planctomycete cytochrome C domain-containing protein [Planctomycetota bacterium]|nr:PSD1 and planctomycete cytochrome C domain-containing protein [Planctomycetota bacterium]MDA1179818.1 PSD1 and planctomycete cytochrome C domain-containing protein [Planctomycetota bacterium]
MARILPSLFWVALACGFLPAAESNSLRFDRDIRPLLSEYCFACHGPDPASRKGELRLDTPEGADHVVTAGDPENSELIRRISSDDPDERMPPAEFGKVLSEGDRATLTQWVKEGAQWEGHWAFLRPSRPPLPNLDEPGIAGHRVVNAIDLFALRTLADVGLTPNEREEPYRLLRRMALDLTGLPPSDALLALYEQALSQHTKDTTPDTAERVAYERAVDHLLASPQAAEHQARFWLDAARYGDTHGMHVDNYREMWPYRDWIIRAFQANMPYDQFVVEQLAGDLLPNPTIDQLVATGFNRCNITTSEGGAIPAEFDARYMVDRVETSATVFMALTAGCAVCHDHKYDPLSQREFYQFGAFFNNTTQPAMDGNQKDTPPALALPGEEFRAEWDALRAQRAELLDLLKGSENRAAQDWPRRATASVDPIANTELLLALPLIESDADRFPLPEHARWADDHPFGRRGIRYHEPQESVIDFPRLRTDEPLSISFWYHTPEEVSNSELLEQHQPSVGEDKKELGWKVVVGTEGDVTFSIFDGLGHDIRGRLPDNDALRPNAWQHICIRYSGGQSSSSISIFSGGREVHLRGETEDRIEATALAAVPLKIGKDLRTAGLSDLRIYRRWLGDEEIQLLAQDGKLRELSASQQSYDQLPSDDQALWGIFSRNVLQESTREANLQLAATNRRFDYIYSRSTTTLITHERSTPPHAHILARGDYTQPLDEVEPGVPNVLPPLPPTEPRNRLGLARWLVTPDHPLTARVMVNRVWLSLFGTGLVKTPEDFGVMGGRPSHPELLDWLAVEFPAAGWDMRHMLKLMVTSATYQQSPRATAEQIAKDPDNTWLARGPRLRLDAEVLRDQALAVAGLLVTKIGGPGVRPYQPAGVWEVVAMPGSNTGKYVQDHGDSLYRRSFYTFWKRTSPPPTMAAFNAPTREQCSVRRERTNTPLQALVTMNDPQFVEAARHLASAAVQRAPLDGDRASYILHAVLRRAPDPKDVDELVHDAHSFGKMFAARPDAAHALIHVGEFPVEKALDPIELASWTMIANTVLNRDDAISK